MRVTSRPLKQFILPVMLVAASVANAENRNQDRDAIREFNLVAILGNHNYFKVAARGIQLDPRTRTGWTYGPLDAQVQEFSY